VLIKKTFFIFLSLLLCLSLFAGDDKYAEYLKNIKGPVKSIFFTESDFYGKQELKEYKYPKEYTFFDEKGRIIEFVFYWVTTGETEIHQKYEYIGDKRIKEKWYYKKETDPYYTSEITYNIKGRIQQEQIFTVYDEFETRRIVYEYPAENEEVILYYNIEDELYKKWIKKYNNEGNIIAELYYYRNLETPKKTVWEYNEAGLLTSRIEYEEDGEVKSTLKKRYDAQGRLIEKLNKTSWAKYFYTYSYCRLLPACPPAQYCRCS
jgi:hypothetical protein